MSTGNSDGEAMEADDLLAKMAEIADAVNRFEDPEAGRIALRALLEHSGIASPNTGRQAPSEPGARGQTDSPPKRRSDSWEEEVYDGLPDDHVVAEGTRDQQAVWAVAQLQHEGQEAGRTEVGQIIKDRLGVSPESADNLSARLGRLAPKTLQRQKRSEGSGYAYRITRTSLSVFSAD